MPPTPYTPRDFAHSPFVVFYETTRACDLACLHCRACAQPAPDPSELSTDQARALIAQLATFPYKPTLVLTGGDPLKRPDVYDLIRHGVACGLDVAMTPSATPLVTPDAVAQLRQAGLSRLAVSLDGADAATHDHFRGVPGSFDHTLRIIAAAHAAGLPVQVNTTITARNRAQVDAMAELLAAQGIVLWSVFLLVPVGRALSEPRLTPQQYEDLFEQLWRHAQRQPYAIKTTEAHHYRRFVLQHKGDPQLTPSASSFSRDSKRSADVQTAAATVTATHPTTAETATLPAPPTPALGSASRLNATRAPLGVNDGKGVMFISHTGEICPSGFLPIACGRFPLDSVVRVYQQAALFKALRDPDGFAGKCGACEFRHVCGGSRARAYALTGNPLASEPDCLYEPARARQEADQPR